MDNNKLIRIAIMLTKVGGKHEYIVFDFEDSLESYTAYPFNSKAAATKKFKELVSSLNEPTKDIYRKAFGLGPNGDPTQINIGNLADSSLPIFVIKLSENVVGDNITNTEGKIGVVTDRNENSVYAWPDISYQDLSFFHRVFPTTGVAEGTAVTGIKPVKPVKIP